MSHSESCLHESPKGPRDKNPTLGRSKLQATDTGAESKGKGAIGSPCLKARLVPKGLGLGKRRQWGRGGRRVSGGGGRWKRQAELPGSRHMGGGQEKGRPRSSKGSRQEATQLGPPPPWVRVPPESLGQGRKPRLGDPRATTTYKAGLGFVAGGTQSGWKRND